MQTHSRSASLVGLVGLVGLVLAIPILGLTLAGLILAGPTGIGPLLPIGCFALGNVLGWEGVRRLYRRERRNVDNP
ncbi:MAG TPA: hypothetical protein VFW20_07270 [Candidatus Limnocylindrales bacterium]|nr:hypothetical protein [Candidatus Limnocylindrales bacterium]